MGFRSAGRALSGVDGTLLNANQRRRVSTHFRLLLEDLDEIVAWPELGRSGEPYDSIRESVRALRAAIESLRATLALPARATLSRPAVSHT